MNSSMEKPYVVGIDIGGTNTVFGIVDARGTIIASGAVKTQVYPTVEEYADEVCKNLLPLIIANGGVDKIKGIGIGAPNGNYYTGTIEFAPNLPWKGVLPLASMFEERLGIPTALTNDANAAAVGEMTYGAARGMKDFIMITLGTGVGSGIVINGQVVYGHDGFAGELGHVIVRRDGRICGCGRKGCLETYCSATGVARTAREFLAARTDASLLRNIPAESIVSKDVYDAAVQGDKLAQEIFEFTGNILGEALADAIAFSSPEAIILFGGLAKSGDYIMKPIMKAMENNLLNIYKGKAKLLVSELKDSDAAVLGASALAWELKDLRDKTPYKSDYLARAPEVIPELFLSVRAGASGCTPISFCQRCHFVFSIASRRAYSDLWFEIRGKNEFQLISGCSKRCLIELNSHRKKGIFFYSVSCDSESCN